MASPDLEISPPYCGPNLRVRAAGGKIVSALSGLRRPMLPLLAIVTMTLGGAALAWQETEAEKPDAFQEAWEKYQLGKPDTALFAAILADESASAKDRFNSAYLLGVIALSEKQYDECIGHLNKAESILSDRPQVSLRLGEALIGKTEYKAAAKVLKKCQKKIKKKNPLYPKLHLALARIDENVTGVAKAAARLEALTRKKVSWDIHFRLATYYERLSKPKPAIDAYARVIESDPKKDPWKGVYAYQRWAAINIAADPVAYKNMPLIRQALEHYKVFLDRADANGVPEKLVIATGNAVSALKILSGD